MVVFQTQAGIAQSVEHFTRNEGVVSSSLISSLPLLNPDTLNRVSGFLRYPAFFCDFSVLALLKIYVIIRG